MLLALLPNVETLKLEVPRIVISTYRSDSLYLSTIFEEMCDEEEESFQMSGLRKLKHLEMRDIPEDEYFPCMPYAPTSVFCRIPTLETLKSHRMLAEFVLKGLSEPGFSNVQDLHLEAAYNSTMTISLIADACVALRSLTVTFDDTIVRPTREVGEALRRHKSSLEKLHIGEFMDRDRDPRDTLGSLKDFLKLRTLEVVQSALIGSPWRRSDRHTNPF